MSKVDLIRTADLELGMRVIGTRMPTPEVVEAIRFRTLSSPESFDIYMTSGSVYLKTDALTLWRKP